MRGRGRGARWPRGRGRGNDVDSRNVHERLGPMPTWSNSNTEYNYRGNFDKSRLGTNRQFHREQSDNFSEGSDSMIIERSVRRSRSREMSPRFFEEQHSEYEDQEGRRRSPSPFRSSVVFRSSPSRRSRSPRFRGRPEFESPRFRSPNRFCSPERFMSPPRRRHESFPRRPPNQNRYSPEERFPDMEYRSPPRELHSPQRQYNKYRDDLPPHDRSPSGRRYHDDFRHSPSRDYSNEMRHGSLRPNDQRTFSPELRVITTRERSSPPYNVSHQRDLSPRRRSPGLRPNSPLRRAGSPPHRMLDSPPMRPGSPPPRRLGSPPPRRLGSPPPRRLGSPPPRRLGSPPPRRIGSPPPRRLGSPPRRRPSSPMRQGSQIRRQGSPPRRPGSPPRRPGSPPRRPGSPPRRPGSPPRRPGSPPRRPGSPPRRPSSPPRRKGSPPRRNGSPPRRQGSPRRFNSPHRQDSPRRRVSLPGRSQSLLRHSPPSGRDRSSVIKPRSPQRTASSSKAHNSSKVIESSPSRKRRSSPNRPESRMPRSSPRRSGSILGKRAASPRSHEYIKSSRKDVSNRDHDQHSQNIKHAGNMDVKEVDERSRMSQSRSKDCQREIVVSDKNISVTKRFSEPDHHHRSRKGSQRTEANSSSKESDDPSTSKRTGRPESWDKHSEKQIAPSPPRISHEARVVSERSSLIRDISESSYGKTLLGYFRERAARAGFSPTKGEKMFMTWQRAGHNEESLNRLVLEEQPSTQSALQLLLVKALSCLSGVELNALNVDVSDLLDQTVSFFMGSGSSRFNSQVPIFSSTGSTSSNPQSFATFGALSEQHISEEQRRVVGYQQNVLLAQSLPPDDFSAPPPPQFSFDPVTQSSHYSQISSLERQAPPPPIFGQPRPIIHQTQSSFTKPVFGQSLAGHDGEVQLLGRLNSRETASSSNFSRF